MSIPCNNLGRRLWRVVLQQHSSSNCCTPSPLLCRCQGKRGLQFQTIRTVSEATFFKMLIHPAYLHEPYCIHRIHQMEWLTTFESMLQISRCLPQQQELWYRCEWALHLGCRLEESFFHCLLLIVWIATPISNNAGEQSHRTAAAYSAAANTS